MLVMGIDPSLTGTGVVLVNEDHGVVEATKFTTDAGEILLKRAIYIASNIEDFYKKYNPDVVSLESPTFGSFTSETMNVLFNFILNVFLKNKTFVVSPAPLQVHSYIKGWMRENGYVAPSKVEKKHIRQAIINKIGIKLRNDEADAYWIALIGLNLKKTIDDHNFILSLYPYETELFLSRKLNGKKIPKGMYYNKNTSFYDFSMEAYQFI